MIAKKNHFVKSRRTNKLPLAVLLLLACMTAVLLAGKAMESAQTQRQARGDLSARFTEKPIKTVGDERYERKDSLMTVLLIGTDRLSSEAPAANLLRTGGQADFLLLIVADRREQTVRTISIDRDTLAEITILGVLGDDMGTRQAQICLAYGFGDGGALSCQLQTKAVSELFGGMEIPNYFAMSLDGIPDLNDAVGGVTVTLQEDFSRLDAQMYSGATLTLRGRQAEYYVRKRLGIGAETNESRMARQLEYLERFQKQLTQRMDEDDGAQVLQSVLDTIDPYVTTNMKRGRMINEIWNTRTYTHLKTAQLQGEHVMGEDGFVAFHADEGALETLICETFYSRLP